MFSMFVRAWKTVWGFVVDVAVAMGEYEFRNATHYYCPQCRGVVRKGTRECHYCAAKLSWWWDQES